MKSSYSIETNLEALRLSIVLILQLLVNDNTFFHLKNIFSDLFTDSVRTPVEIIGQVKNKIIT